MKKDRKNPTALILRFVALLLCLLLGGSVAPGYMIRRPFSLQELTAKADVVFKGTVISSVPGGNASDGDRKTQFKIVSVLKGADPGPTVTFLHRDMTTYTGHSYMEIDPVNYHFDVGKTYLVFAKATTTPGVCQALWDMPETSGNQGVFLCADDKTTSLKMQDAVGTELTGLLLHHDNADVLYAIQQLDKMSGEGWGPDRSYDSTLDFSRKSVVDTVHGFIAHSDPKVAEAAIRMLGSNNPYMTQERVPYWLATVGSGKTSGLVEMDPKMKNLGGEFYWSDLAGLANSKAPEATRALAIRALGLVRKPEVEAQLGKWLTDSSPQVRAAAAVLLADYPDLATPQQLSQLAADPEPGTRIATAQGIGFGQVKGGVKVLSTLLADPDLEVRKAAAMCLLSFSASDPEVASVLKANLHGHEFADLFILSLARVDPEPYRDDLVRIMESWTPTSPSPAWWWGGSVPCYDAREILLSYLKNQPADKFKAGGLDPYLDAIDKASLLHIGSPFDIYALYIRHGLNARAQALRQAALTAFPYQQPGQYDQAAEHPEIYHQ